MDIFIYNKMFLLIMIKYNKVWKFFSKFLNKKSYTLYIIVFYIYLCYYTFILTYWLNDYEFYNSRNKKEICIVIKWNIWSYNINLSQTFMTWDL